MTSITLSKTDFPSDWNHTKQRAAQATLNLIEKKVNCYLEKHNRIRFNNKTLDVSFDLHHGVKLNDGKMALTLSFNELKLREHEYMPLFPDDVPSSRRSSNSSDISEDTSGDEDDELSVEAKDSDEIQGLRQQLQQTSDQYTKLYKQTAQTHTMAIFEKDIQTCLLDLERAKANQLIAAYDCVGIGDYVPHGNSDPDSQATYTKLYQLVYSYYEKKLPILSASTNKTPEEHMLIKFLQELRSIKPGKEVIPFLNIYLDLYKAEKNNDLATVLKDIDSSIKSLKEDIFCDPINNPASTIKKERKKLFDDNEFCHSMSLPLPPFLYRFFRQEKDYNFDVHQSAGTTPQLEKALLQRYKELHSCAQAHATQTSFVQAQAKQTATRIREQMRGVDQLLNISIKPYPLPDDIPNAATLFPLLQQIPAHYPITHPQKFIEIANTLDLELRCYQKGCPQTHALIQEAKKESEAWLKTQEGQLYTFLNTSAPPQSRAPLTRPSTVAANPPALRQASQPLCPLQRGIYPEAELTAEEYQRQLLLQQRLNTPQPTTAPLQTLAQRNVSFNNSTS